MISRNPKRNTTQYAIRKFASAILIFTITSLSTEAQNCTVNAGTDKIICASSTQSQLQEGNIGGNFVTNTLTWTQVSGPNTATISNSTSVSPTISGFTGGTYVFRMQSTCQAGGNATDLVTYTVSNSATPVSPANMSIGCYTPGTAINLTGTAPAGHTLTWSFTGSNAPTSGTFNGNTNTSVSGNNPNVRFSAPPQTYCTGYWGSEAYITVRSTDNTTGCYEERSFTIYFKFNPGAVSAVAFGGCGPVSLFGSCPNDGTGTWTVVSSPAGSPAVSFSPNANSFSSTPGNLVAGNYTFRWTVSGSSCGNGFADASVSVVSGGSSVTQPDVKSMNFCSGSLPSTISLNGTLPKSGETVSWTKVSGGAVTITNATSPIAQASGLTAAGAPYIFKYTITGSGCPKSDTMQVTVTKPLTYQPTDQGLCSSDFYIHSTMSTLLGTIPFLQADSIPVGIIYESGPVNNLQLTFKAEMKDVNGNNVGTSYYSPVINFTKGQTASYTYKASTLWPTYNSYNAGLSAAITTQNNIAGCNNLVPGIYRFRLMLKDDCGSFISEPFKIEVNVTVGLNAGSDQRVTCGTTSTTLAGNSVRCEVTPYWTTAKKPAAASDPITAGNKYTRNVSLSSLSVGTYVFVWQTDQGGSICASTADSVRVTVSSAPPATPTVTGSGTYCTNTPVNISGALNDDATDGTWTVSSSPAGGTYTISSTTAPNIVFIPTSASTTYTLTWTVANGCGTAAASTTVITNGNTGAAPVISNADNCYMSNWTSFGTLSATGGPGVWTSSNPNYTLATPNSSSTTVSPTYSSSSGAVTFYYSTTGTCSGLKDSVTFTGWDTPTMTTTNFCSVSSFPVAQSLTVNTLIPYAKYEVTGITGPGSPSVSPMVFTPTSNSQTLTLNASQAGKYNITLKRITGVCSTSPVTFGIQLSAAPALAIAGSDINLCGSSNSGTLNAQPNPLGSSEGAWSVSSVYSGYAPVFSNAGSPVSNVTFSQGAGDVLLRWSVTGSNFSCNNSTVDYVRVRYIPAADAGDNKFTCYDATNSPAAIVLDANTASSANGVWSVVSQPSGANASFINPAAAGTTVTNLTNGSYNLRWTITDPTGTCPTTSSTVMASVYYGCTVLPVELVSFTAKASQDDALLSWNVTNDEANTLYIPERSLSVNGPFKSLVSIKYNVTLNGNYEFIDNDAANAGSNYLYYRLAIRSASNKLSYSKTAAVRFTKESSILVYPNIADRGTPVTIDFNNNNTGTFYIRTVSVNGQLMNEQTITNPRSTKIQTDKFPAGTYFMQVNNGQQTFAFKLIVK